MTTELVLLLALYAFVLGGALFGENGPKATFESAAPRLAARLEEHIATGSGFTEDPKEAGRPAPRWRKPGANPPGGF